MNTARRCPVSRRQLALCALLVLVAAAGCGTYRTTYIMSNEKPSYEVDHLTYSHGFGIVGGGGFFFAVHRMLPCFADYTGPVDLSAKCPEGFYKVEQYNTFGQNSVAAFISWLIILNPYHPTAVEITHARK